MANRTQAHSTVGCDSCKRHIVRGRISANRFVAAINSRSFTVGSGRIVMGSCPARISGGSVTATLCDHWRPRHPKAMSHGPPRRPRPCLREGPRGRPRSRVVSSPNAGETSWSRAGCTSREGARTENVARPQRVRRRGVVQFSTSRPVTRSNSSVLFVTRVKPSARACAAMKRSLAPISAPRRFKSARIRA